MPSVEAAVSWAEAVAADPAHGYSQSDRLGPDYDCSSLVWSALRSAGLDVPSRDFNTRTMGGWLGDHGWTWHSGTAGVRRGDVLWKVGHTGLAASGSTAVEARGDERGGITGGRPGDQTGREIGVFAIASMAWAGYWRYEGESEEDMDSRDVDEIWSFDNGGDPASASTGAARNAWRRLCDIDQRTSEWYHGLLGNQGMLSNVYDTNAKVTAMTAQVAALSEAVRALAGAQGADPDAIASAVSEAVERKLESIQLSVTVGD